MRPRARIGIVASGASRLRRLTLAPAALLLLALLSCSPVSGSPTASTWVDETLSRLTLRQKVGQLVAPWLAGDFLATDSDAYDRVRDWVVEQGIGGLVISIGPPLEVASKLNLIQELADIPLLITADMEHGPGQRLDGGVVMPHGMYNGSGTHFPPVMALGAADDERLAFELGRITAREARAVGIGMIFAPVVDVNNNPANPVINTRSYGADPVRVARLATAHLRGLQDYGVYSVVKHFPGHGDTGVDSHIDLPLIPVDRARADSVELLPFRAAIAAGATGVMSAHITFPALTGDSTPATLSPRILTGLLQDELGFSGLVVSDALDMGAIVRRYGSGEAMIRALEAGADLLLMPPNLPAALDEVVAAVESGRLTEARIDRSVRKILELKEGLGLPSRRTVDLDRVPDLVGGRAHHAVAEEVATRSITLVRDRDDLIPLGAAPADAPRVYSISYIGDPDPLAGRAFHQTLAPRVRSLRTVQVDPNTSGARLDSIYTEASRADLVLVSTYVRVMTGKGSVAIPEQVAALIARLDRARPTIVASFGNPYLLEQFPEIGTYLLAWGPQEVAQRAAANAILGLNPITGTLPIPLSARYPIGSGLRREAVVAVRDDAGGGDTAGDAVDDTIASTVGDTARGTRVDTAAADLAASSGATGNHASAVVVMDSAQLAGIDELVEAAIRDGAIPGGALAIGRRGELVRLRGYGHLDPGPGSAAATDSSIYDLASLTKVVGTTTAVMLLVEESRLDLDAPVSRYLPEWRGSPGGRWQSAARDQVTVRHLMLHTAGLPAYSPLWREVRGRDAILHRIAALDLEYRPGTREVYSDLGMILVGLIVERITGQPLDIFLEERIFHPLGLRETGFNPRTWAPDPASGLLARKAVPGSLDDDVSFATSLMTTADAGILARIAPTEVDMSYRMTHLHGVVHDENAYAIGGVAGHAGLFSSVRDLAVFAQFLLDGGRGIIQPETIRAFTTPVSGTTARVSGSSRALGWETAAGRSSAGDLFSADSFGHTGFTGTSIWIDPERELFVVFLTNRINPTRANRGHLQLRRKLHDAVQLAVIDEPAEGR